MCMFFIDFVTGEMQMVHEGSNICNRKYVTKKRTKGSKQTQLLEKKTPSSVFIPLQITLFPNSQKHSFFQNYMNII